ncbi:hypothetical protein COO60DRAFT_1495014 [Scenedesmus sp. NREL 46B-D3]|nr:hypothetical protein COO60DRAFT_1495014 [Scenedesmus sp. NREL 46B-D3]
MGAAATHLPASQQPNLHSGTQHAHQLALTAAANTTKASAAYLAQLQRDRQQRGSRSGKAAAAAAGHAAAPPPVHAPPQAAEDSVSADALAPWCGCGPGMTVLGVLAVDCRCCHVVSATWVWRMMLPCLAQTLQGAAAGVAASAAACGRGCCCSEPAAQPVLLQRCGSRRAMGGSGSANTCCCCCCCCSGGGGIGVVASVR